MEITEGRFSDIWLHRCAFCFNCTKVQKNRQNEKEILNYTDHSFFSENKYIKAAKNTLNIQDYQHIILKNI
jgi:hypothetical protein